MDEKLTNQITAALQKLARNQKLKAYILNHPEIYTIILRAARKYVAGEIMQDALALAVQLNNTEIATTIDYCGENTFSKKDADEATTEFRHLIDAVANAQINSSISLDLSHIGLSVDRQTAMDNLILLTNHAMSKDIEVMISMEESKKNHEIMECYFQLADQYKNLGITTQAYIKEEDYSALMKSPGKLRIVKGAYEEEPGSVYPRGEVLNKNFLKLVEMSLSNDKSISIGTHDLDLIEKVIEMLAPNNLQYVEFEMLYGVNEQKLVALNKRGLKVRSYIVYGSEWYLYYCHRLAENPEKFIEAFSSMVLDNH